MYKCFRHIIGVLLRVHWLKTIYLNFRILPFSSAVKLPFVVTGKTHFRSLTGKVEFQCPIRFGLVNIGRDIDNMPISYVPAQLFLQGKLVIQGSCVVNQGANVVVWPHGILKLGEGLLICSGVLLKATHYISIGKCAMISSGCFIMDSNIHCIRDMETGRVTKPTKPIHIGNYCWLSMNTSVMGGSTIPDCCITSRSAFINKNFDDINIGSFLVGTPAVPIRENLQRVISFDREYEIHQFFLQHPEADYFQSFLGIEDVNNNEQSKFFSI